jgi:hypothetical protein
MKTIFTLLVWLIVQVASSQEIERKTVSKIKEVTVFLNGAQVTRSASLDVQPGTTTWVISGISPRINEQSIQVGMDSRVKLLAVSYRVNHLEEIKKTDRVQELEKEKVRFQDLLEHEKANLEVYHEEESMLKSNKEIGGTQGVNINDLKIAVDYFRTRLADIKQKQMDATTHIKGYLLELSRIDAQLQELKNRKARPTGEVVIKTSSKSEVKVNMNISYVVQEAKWYPSYDIRAKDIKSPISLMYKANVSQQSDEDWENVKLTISSANPSVLGSQPILHAWYLGFNNSLASRATPFVNSGILINPSEVRGRVTSAEDGSPLPGVNVVIKGTTVGTATDANGEYSLPLTSDAQVLVFSFIGLQTQELQVGGRNLIDVNLGLDVTELSEVVVTGYGVSGDKDWGNSNTYQPRVKKTIVATPVVRSTNVEYVIDEPYSIRSDGEIRTVEMIEYEMDASYQYYCAPKLDVDAFLVARITDWDEYNLLEGETSLFFEGKYVGKSILDTRNIEDTLSLSLGRDKNVLVTREKIKGFSSKQLLGANRKVLFAYEIVVRNKKQYEIYIRIEDQLPVPNTKEIVVDRIEDSDAIRTADTGLLVWNKKVAPGQTTSINLKYAVKHPKDSWVILE